ncbi:hypothetical protein G3N56_06150 [Desulfovibrio sulfodismutans]|uniref:Uncharacterized protein n=1 Tax=Desulfolutivibrio sulfodismutans TaxID=63561 RepID=A0A7K3NJE8_9BACT|nr:hypothetical protein [Desulfolutivibrio sulfodismutans]NDY56324.1 hypothetical protein [Desulfolutivibrio sulfodismutans]QLA14191.1 hypothetical protein GD606_18925 [Desulfolutivibrio sulfodismutans DSM 3696]
MGREHPMEVVGRAEELYCVDGLTFDDTAVRAGVAVSTVKRWAERYGWQAKREEIRQALSAIRTDTIRLRAKLINNCLGSLQAMDAFAVAKMEEVALKAMELADKRAESTPPASPPLREITSEADAVAALEEAVGIRLSALLASPDKVTLTALKEIKTVLDLLKDMRAQAVPETDEARKDRGLTAATADRIRAILGGQE